MRRIGLLATTILCFSVPCIGADKEGPPANPCNLKPPTRQSCMDCLRRELRDCRDLQPRDAIPDDIEWCRRGALIGYSMCIAKVLGVDPPAISFPATTPPKAAGVTLYRADINDDLALDSADLFTGIDWLVRGDVDQVWFFNFLTDFFNQR